MLCDATANEQFDTASHYNFRVVANTHDRTHNRMHARDISGFGVLVWQHEDNSSWSPRQARERVDNMNKNTDKRHQRIANRTVDPDRLGART